MGLKRNRKFWTLIAIAWICIAILSASLLHIRLSASEVNQVDWGTLVLIKLAIWLFWAILTPLIFKWGRIYGIFTTKVWIHLCIHFLAGTLLVTLNLLFYAFVATALTNGLDKLLFINMFINLFLTQFEWFFLIYWLILLAGYVFEYFKSKEKQAEAKAELYLAKLHALKMQLHPHFLYNTLNTISSMMRIGRSKESQKMISELSDLLRKALNHKDDALVHLEVELDFVVKYLEIEKIRFGGHLNYSIDIPAKYFRYQVPNLLLQPLVENAVYYGISKSLVASEIRISCDQVDSSLRIIVFNEGPPVEDGINLGVGLGSVKERLIQLYGEDQAFELINESNGVRVEITVPISISEVYEEV